WAGLAGQVVCAGGVNGSVTLSNSFSYEPGSDSWSPIADMPFDLWGSASGGPNGMLVLASGVTNGFNTVTNQAIAYDPGTDSWASLPNARRVSREVDVQDQQRSASEPRRAGDARRAGIRAGVQLRRRRLRRRCGRHLVGRPRVHGPERVGLHPEPAEDDQHEVGHRR